MSSKKTPTTTTTTKTYPKTEQYKTPVSSTSQLNDHELR